MTSTAAAAAAAAAATTAPVETKREWRLLDLGDAKGAMLYPFSYIGRDFAVDDFARPTPFAQNREIEASGFPEQIDRVYHYREGENEEESWQLMCSWLNDDKETRVFGWYEGSCDFSGFYCQGSMSLVISDSLEDLFSTGIDEEYQADVLESQKEDK